MSKKNQLTRQFRKQLSNYQREPQVDVGILGNGHGVVQVPGTNRYCYVRIRNMVVVALNMRTSYVNNLEVLVGYDDLQPDVFQVLDAKLRGGVDFETNFQIGPHHETHEWGNVSGGGDVVWVNLRQFMPLRVTKSTGLSITVESGYVRGSNNWVRASQVTALDLTSHKPGTGARYVLIQAAGDGTINAKSGTIVSSANVLTDADIPMPDEGSFPLAAIRMYSTQTVLSENIYNSDIKDLRFPGYSNQSGKVLIYHDDDFVVSGSAINFIGDSFYVIASGSVAFVGLSGTGNIIQDEGSSLPSRNFLNFVGSGVVVTDDPGNNATKVEVASFAISGNVSPAICQGRLTLVTGTATPVSDVSGVGTLRFTPYNGNFIGLHDGASTWNVYSFSEISYTVTGTAANTNYDVFVTYNTGTANIQLELVAWSADHVRGTQLTLQDGIYVKGTDSKRRYLGTVRTVAANQIDDSETKRFVWNYYNRIERAMAKTDNTSHSYSAATNRYYNNDSSNKIEIVIGLIDCAHEFFIYAQTPGNWNYYACMLGLPPTGTIMGSTLGTTSGATRLSAYNRYYFPYPGYHFMSMIERSDGSSRTFTNCTIGMVPKI